MKVVNLARRPFLNAKPVVRTAAFLWILGAMLLAYNVWLYTRYLTGSASARAQLAEVAEELEHQEGRLDRAEERLKALDLFEQNEKVLYLNRLISQRTFPWSQLFEDLEDVLPRKVRLLNVSPNLEVEERRRRRRRRGGGNSQPVEAPKEWVNFRFNAVAATEKDMYAFLDNLYDPEGSFGRPVLANEAVEAKNQELRFNLDVPYFPKRPELQITVAEAGDAENLDENGMPAESGLGEGTGSVARASAGDGQPTEGSTGSEGSETDGTAGSSLAAGPAEDPDAGPFSRGTRIGGQEPASAAGSEATRTAGAPSRGTGNRFAPPTSSRGRDTGEAGSTPSGRGAAAGATTGRVIAGTPLLPQGTPSSSQPASSGQQPGSTPPAGQQPQGGDPQTSPQPSPNRPADPGRAASGTPRLQQGGGR